MGQNDARKPLEYMNTIPDGVMEEDIKSRRDLDRMHPDHHNFLGVAKVTQVNFEEWYITLRIVQGSHDEFDRVPIPVTLPGAGARHIFGCLPDVGDHCVVGWMPQESSEGNWGTKTPVILSWIIPGVWPGREWLTTSGFPVEEFDAGSPKDREIVRSVFDRIRHKLPSAQPGNIFASSSQGSDMFLDESVYLSNRRGNEIILRDQDQALVVRSLQQFHAMSGARIYGGMVQRDARLLATSMVSDGKEWDGRRQSVDREPLHENDLPVSPEPEGYLTPARVLARGLQGVDTGYKGRSVQSISPRMDPYTFLQQGGFIDEGGFVLDESHKADAVYGGKQYFRVAAQSLSNAALDPDAPTLTEWRMELAHTSTGRLPVTEQTDGLDAERLPRTDASTNDPQGLNPNSRYLEVIYGSVVGNDPYSQTGRERYGLPLVAKVFDGPVAAPRIDPARIVTNPGGGESSTPIGDHLASLFRLSPRVARGAPDTFWGVTKKGQLRGSLSGPQDENSVEVAVRGGLKLAVGGKFDFQLTQALRLSTDQGDPKDNVGVTLESKRGAVRIFGGASKKGPDALGKRLAGAGEGEGSLPSLELVAQTNAHLIAAKKILIKGDEIEVNGRSFTVNGHQEIALNAADKIGMSAKSLDQTILGKATRTFTGPKDFLPTNGALEESTYMTFPGLPAKQTNIIFGDRVDNTLIGNHLANIAIGNFVYTVGVGNISLTAGTSNFTMTPVTITGVTTGALALESTAGPAVLSGTLNASLIAKAGPALVRGSTGIALSAPADFNIGPIIAAGSLDPLTGLPFITWGMGAKFHLITP